ALPPRRGPRLRRARRARAGPGAHGLALRLASQRRADQLPGRRLAPRTGPQDDLRPPWHLRLARRLQPVPPEPEARVVLRGEALELLRAGGTRRQDAAWARAAVSRRPRGRARARRDPAAPGALHR